MLLADFIAENQFLQILLFEFTIVASEGYMRAFQMSNFKNKNCSELLLTNGMGLDRAQGCHSEFGSNKVRKMVRQGKEKRLLARIFKILGKARKRLSRQNSTIKVRKCEEKRPEFTKKSA